MTDYFEIAKGIMVESTNAEVMSKKILEARAEFQRRDPDDDAWLATNDMLAEVFEEPEHLLPQILTILEERRRESARRLNSFSPLGSYHSQNIDKIDAKIARVKRTIEFIANLRSQKCEG